MQTSTLRPGLLVSLKTSIRGNVKYYTTDLGTTVTVDGGEESRWETNRHIADKGELERATKARSKARSMVASVCAQSAFGLLCPEAKADQLDAAVRDAQRVVSDFNDDATVSRLSLYIMAGRIAPDDVEAVRAINSEIRDLMDSMAEGLRNLDVTVIRDAASRARNITQMLEPAAQERAKQAIEVARSAARQIVKAAEIGAAEVDRGAIARITEARTSFLDMDDSGAPIGEVTHAGRAVDLAPETVREIQAPAPAQARMFEL